MLQAEPEVSKADQQSMFHQADVAPRLGFNELFLLHYFINYQSHYEKVNFSAPEVLNCSFLQKSIAHYQAARLSSLTDPIGLLKGLSEKVHSRITGHLNHLRSI
jgi:hypothetical protein